MTEEKAGESMGSLRIYEDTGAEATIVSNRFIDEYMAEANDAQLKVYLYLLRRGKGLRHILYCRYL
mgnify:CR=1 FL=1